MGNKNKLTALVFRDKEQRIYDLTILDINSIDPRRKSGIDPWLSWEMIEKWFCNEGIDLVGSYHVHKKYMQNFSDYLGTLNGEDISSLRSTLKGLEEDLNSRR